MKVAERNIGKTLTRKSSANIFVCGDFNAHNKDCLAHSNDIDVDGIFGMMFLSQDFTKIPNTKPLIEMNM